MNNEFNNAAAKIVSKKEFFQKYKAYVAAELSPAEKALRYLTLVPGTYAGVIEVVRTGVSNDLQDHYRDIAGDGTCGFYKDPISGEQYYNTAVFLEMMRITGERHPICANKPEGLHKKFEEMTLRAINDCKDYAPAYRAGELRLKPQF